VSDKPPPNTAGQKTTSRISRDRLQTNVNQSTTLGAGPDWHKIQQIVKWMVYALLIVNFVFYILEDSRRAVFTLHAGSTFLDWTSAFATTLDESAWFLLLAMFEIETYVLEDEDLTGWVAMTLHGVRLTCYALLAHTVYAFLIVVSSLQPTVAVEGISDLCDLTDADVSFVYNLEYTDINDQTCDDLSSDTEFYRVAKDPVVTDMEGLSLERDLALADLAEAVLWLLAILAIEVVVRLQGHGVSGGKIISTANALKVIIYASLIGLGVYWATLSHWLYLWDELLWIGGFAAIEMNLSEWRDEIDEKQVTTLEMTK